MQVVRSLTGVAGQLIVNIIFHMNNMKIYKVTYLKVYSKGRYFVKKRNPFSRTTTNGLFGLQSVLGSKQANVVCFAFVLPVLVLSINSLHLNAFFRIQDFIFKSFLKEMI